MTSISMTDVSMDALAVVASAYHGDSKAVELMHMTYKTADERAHLYGAILGVSVSLLRVIQQLGVDPDKALGAALAALREAS